MWEPSRASQVVIDQVPHPKVDALLGIWGQSWWPMGNFGQYVGSFESNSAHDKDFAHIVASQEKL